MPMPGCASISFQASLFSAISPQVQPRGKIARVAIKHFEITRHSAVVAHICQSGGILCGLGKQLFLLPEFLILAVSNEGIRNLTECLLNGLLIDEDCFLLLRFCQPDIRTNFAAP